MTGEAITADLSMHCRYAMASTAVAQADVPTYQVCMYMASMLVFNYQLHQLQLRCVSMTCRAFVGSDAWHRQLASKQSFLCHLN